MSKIDAFLTMYFIFESHLLLNLTQGRQKKLKSGCTSTKWAEKGGCMTEIYRYQKSGCTLRTQHPSTFLLGISSASTDFFLLQDV